MNRNDKSEREDSFMDNEKDKFVNHLHDIISKSEVEPSPMAWEQMQPFIEKDNKWYHIRRVTPYVLTGIIVCGVIYFLYTRKETKPERSSRLQEGILKTKESSSSTKIEVMDVDKQKVKTIAKKYPGEKAVLIQTETDIETEEDKDTKEMPVASENVPENKIVDEEVVIKTTPDKTEKKVVLKDSVFEYRQLFKKK